MSLWHSVQVDLFEYLAHPIKPTGFWIQSVPSAFTKNPVLQVKHLSSSLTLVAQLTGLFTLAVQVAPLFYKKKSVLHSRQAKLVSLNLEPDWWTLQFGIGVNVKQSLSFSVG